VYVPSQLTKVALNMNFKITVAYISALTSQTVQFGLLASYLITID